ncbi:MAG: FG-GAP-like repeat-containing protein, partial [Gemmataceae bacterium]|nr:FG-GAP-like repeat-containing protein [Gemmataceae bacterium]
MSNTAPARRRLLPGLLLLALLLAVGVGGYFWWNRTRPVPPAGPDLTAALAANARGVAHAERFTEFPAAEKEFEEVTRLAPDWLPGHVNRGIAAFNQNNPEAIARGRAIFAEVLARDPDNRHAHYCLGIIDSDAGRFADAHAHFQKVNALDPNDAHTWLRLGLTHPAGPRSPEARECFEQSLKRDPYLNAARYNLYLILVPSDPERAKALEAERLALHNALWESEADIRYGIMGKYADVIGRDPAAAVKAGVGPLPMFEAVADLKLTLAPGARWATAADLSPTARAARARFGGAVVLFDYNGDGRPDVLLLSAVVEGGKVRDLLLRNDGNGAFTDVTAAAGLATPRPSLGAAAGDFDNDGRPDLVITGDGEQHLFRNTGDGTFEDASAAAGLDKLKGLCLGCGWLDIDQDGDLDLVVCVWGAAGGGLDGPKPGGELVLLENVGVAPPVAPNAPPQGLSVAFKRSEAFAKFPAQSAASFLASDLDSDRDVDLLVLPEAAD